MKVEIGDSLNRDRKKNYKVAGAGNLVMELGSVCSCGGARGVGISVSWGKHGYAGGVMDIKKVRKLVNDLTNWITEVYLKERRR